MKKPDAKRQEITYSLTYRDVVEILRLVNESSRCESLELQLGDLRLSATRAPSVSTPLARPPATEAPAEIPAEAVQPGERVAQGEAPAAGPAIASGLVVVRAPMLGTFYRAPAPGRAPYVEPGDVVGKDDTIGLIDVMKLFTQIPAGLAGRVVEILAEDAALVEHGQPLILIDPLQGERPE